MPVEVNPASRARLRAAQRAFRGLERGLKDELRKAQRAQLGPIWREEMKTAIGRSSARGGMHGRLFSSGSRVKAGIPAYLIAGGSNKRLSGGGIVSDLVRPYEFGTGRRGQYTRYQRGGRRAATVVRRTSQQLPLRRQNGYVVHPAVAGTIPRLYGVYAAEATRSITNAIEGR